MYLIFVMTGVLLYSSITRTVFNLPLVWSVEFSQFTMSAYYLLGGAYAMLMRGHVRMDLFYDTWSSRKQGVIDAITDLCLIFYLVVLLIGAVSSIEYAVQYNQVARSAWGPPLAPVKIVMGLGILLMLLQSISTFFKDLAKARGKSIV
ncbi:TRAP transporter small permease subunit [Arhodomonas sp. AD133]|uniref:TRAP transporter small permease subunit n=1 Tax=Arhodomonas sp. AD133 TaxID=3415009 RepID=UPI003EBD7573